MNFTQRANKFLELLVIKSRRMRWTGYVVRNGNTRNAYNILVRKHEEKKLHGKPRHRWEDHIRIGLSEIGSKGVEWMHLAQECDQWWAVVNTVMNLRVS
jgi:hypothetical protein